MILRLLPHATGLDPRKSEITSAIAMELVAPEIAFRKTTQASKTRNNDKQTLHVRAKSWQLLEQ